MFFNGVKNIRSEHASFYFHDGLLLPPSSNFVPFIVVVLTLHLTPLVQLV